MAETDADISKALGARADRKRKGKKENGLASIHELPTVELPADALEFEGERTIAEPEDKVIVNLGPGVDIVEPAEPSSIVLKEKEYIIRRRSKNPLLPG